MRPALLVPVRVHRGSVQPVTQHHWRCRSQHEVQCVRQQQLRAVVPVLLHAVRGSRAVRGGMPCRKEAAQLDDLDRAAKKARRVHSSAALLVLCKHSFCRPCTSAGSSSDCKAKQAGTRGLRSERRLCEFESHLQGNTGMSVLEVGSQASYRPKTRETRAAYEALLSFIQVPRCCSTPALQCCCCLPGPGSGHWRPCKDGLHHACCSCRARLAISLQMCSEAQLMRCWPPSRMTC